MQYRWEFDHNEVNWKELSDLYKIAPLGNKDPKKLEIVFANSMYKYFVYVGSKLVGAGRCLSDGFDCAYICDIAIHPDYQGFGLGSVIINKFIEDTKGFEKVILYSVPGKEEFYSKFGFEKMTTAMAIFKNQKSAYEKGLVS